jgi:hypothetical protein
MLCRVLQEPVFADRKYLNGETVELDDADATQFIRYKIVEEIIPDVPITSGSISVPAPDLPPPAPVSAPAPTPLPVVEATVPTKTEAAAAPTPDPGSTDAKTKAK